MSDAQLQAVAGVLSDPGNAERSADEVAQLVLDELESLRKRSYKYVVIAQDRSARPTTASLKAGVHNPRYFVPTWVLGPFCTLAEAAKAAREARARGLRAMGAELKQPDGRVEPADLKEVLA